jgi:tetratricopeptide (TPR) repeat protein
MSNTSSTMNPRRRLNLKVLLILLGATASVVVGVVVLHNLQVRRTVSGLLRQAERQEKAGNLEKAAESLEVYVGFRRNDAEGLSRLGRIIDKKAKTPPQRYKAALTLESAARVDPSRTDDLRRAAELFTQVGQHKIAKPHWEALLKKDPTDGEIEGKLALGALALSKYAEADTLLAAAIGHSPHLVNLYSQRAFLLRNRLNAPDRARQTVDAMVQANSESATAYIERGRFRLATRQDGVADDLARARALAPEDPQVVLLASQLALRDGSPERALDELGRAIATTPKLTALHMMLYRTLTALGRTEQSISALRKAMEIFPDDLEIRTALAEALLLAGRVEDATKIVADIKKSAANSPALVFLEASVQMARREWAAALEKLESISLDLASSPELDRSANYNLGRCYEELARLEKALSCYRHVAEIAPDWLPGRLRHASALAGLGRLDEAIREFRALPSSAPGVRASLIRLRIVQNSRLPREKREWNDVEKILIDGEKESPRSLEPIGLRVETLLARGRIADARALVEKAKVDFPDAPYPSLSLAALLQAEGKPDEALAMLDKAEAKFGDVLAIRQARARYWSDRGGPESSKALAALRNDLAKFSQAEQSLLLDTLAMANLRLGNREESSQLMVDAAERAPGNLQLRIRQLDSAVESGEDAAIRAVVDDLRKIEGDAGIYWKIGEANRLLILAERQKSVVGLKEARSLLDDVIRRRSDLGDAYRLMGVVDDLEGKTDAAIASFQRAVQLGRRQVGMIGRLTQILVERERYTEADKTLQLLDIKGERPVELKKLAASLALRSNDLARAEALARQAVAADSKVADDHLWQAQVLENLGRFPDAEVSARRAIALDRASGQARVMLVEILSKAGMKDKASAAAAEAEAALGPESRLESAQIAEALGRKEIARERFEAALAARAGDLTTLREVGRHYFSSGDGLKAAAIYRKILDPSKAATQAVVIESRRGLASILTASRRTLGLQEAESLVNQNLRARPDSAVDLRLKARILAGQPSRRKDALKAYEQARAGQPLSADDAFVVVQLLEAEGEWTAARQQILSLIAGDTPPTGLLAWYVGRLLRHGEVAEARDVWLPKLEKAAPAVFETVVLRARLLAATNQPEAAVKLLETRATTSTDEAILIGQILEELRQGDAAVRVLGTAARSGKNPNATLALAAVLARQGKLSEALDLCDSASATCAPEAVAGTYLTAIQAGGEVTPAARARVEKALEAAIAKNKNNSTLYSTLALVRLLDGRRNETEDLYKQGMAVSSTDSTLLNNLAWMLCFADGRAEEAVALAERAIAKEGPEAHYLDTLGLALLSNGRPDRAVVELGRSIDGKPHDIATVHFHLARAQLALKNTAAARESLRRGEALGLRPEVLHPLELPSYRAIKAALDPK